MTDHGFNFNGISFSNNNLSDLSQTPDVDYILKIKQEINAYPQYTVVTSPGLVRVLKYGTFELRGVGYIYYTSNVKRYSVTLTICETRLGALFQETLDCTSGIQVY